MKILMSDAVNKIFLAEQRICQSSGKLTNLPKRSQQI